MSIGFDYNDRDNFVIVVLVIVRVMFIILKIILIIRSIIKFLVLFLSLPLLLLMSFSFVIVIVVVSVVILIDFNDRNNVVIVRIVNVTMYKDTWSVVLETWTMQRMTINDNQLKSAIIQ